MMLTVPAGSTRAAGPRPPSPDTPSIRSAPSPTYRMYDDVILAFDSGFKNLFFFFLKAQASRLYWLMLGYGIFGLNLCFLERLNFVCFWDLRGF